MIESSPPTIAWPNLVRALHNCECILVLGPEVATLERQGQRVSLQTLLTEHLTAEVQRRQPNEQLFATSNLAYVAKTLEDAIFVQEVRQKPNYSRENARAALALQDAPLSGSTMRPCWVSGQGCTGRIGRWKRRRHWRGRRRRWKNQGGRNSRVPICPKLGYYDASKETERNLLSIQGFFPCH